MRSTVLYVVRAGVRRSANRSSAANRNPTPRRVTHPPRPRRRFAPNWRYKDTETLADERRRLIASSPTESTADASGRVWKIVKLPSSFAEPLRDARPQRLRNEIRRARPIA